MKEKGKTKKRSVAGIVLFIVLAIVAVYIAFQVIMVMNPSFKTSTAIRYDLNDSITAQAYIAMPQEEIGFSGGVPDYLIDNGDKVEAGGAIARIFASAENAQNYAEAQRVNAEISLLKSAQISTPGVNIESLLLQSKASLHSIIDKADKRNFLSIADEKIKYQSSVNKTQITTGKAQSFEERINALLAKEQDLLSQSGETSVIYSPANGYFVSSKYSKAQTVTPAELADMTPLQLQQASQTQSTSANENVLGRLIYDYKWTCYLSVSFENSKKFIEGKTVYLYFEDISLNQIPAKVTAIQTDEANGIAKITLSGDYMTADIAAVQLAKANVIFPYSSTKIPYTGIRVPKEALRAVNGETGVYIRYGNLAQYKKIEVLFENENYVLAPLAYEKGRNELRMYDEIITQGRGLLPQPVQQAEPESSSNSQINSEE